MKLSPCSNALNGILEIPGDKSISHRAVILGSLAKGTTKVTHFLTGEDCLRTINAFKLLGVDIEVDNTTLYIRSNGLSHFKEPKEPIYFGNSGTTARLMLGVLSGLPFFTTSYGDDSLTSRPMDRVIIPLEQMGASINGRSDASYLPLSISGGGLKGVQYVLPVKSAQVKSAILLASLFAEGTTEVIEPTPTRNHSENMLKAFGADITIEDTISITNEPLTATDVFVPGDISSAAFFMVAAAIVPGSNLTLKNVGLNFTRTGIIDVLTEMGASISISNKQTISGEDFGDITISYSKLQGIVINGDIIPRLIDELPIIALLATQAEGETVIGDAEELRLKETDRIEAVVEGFTTLGAKVKSTKDGMIIEGNAVLGGGSVNSYNDHRIAMMYAIASLITQKEVVIDDVSSIAISYPNFFQDLTSVCS
ncbi:3-phosphoshikimate 1-carboxyvinyltransferase [Virgibacillus litoralis]|uniref:3-phosphoshikimate 1-carboxyvinyltransferase n=1 Tax=Virgibacillus litoralis TaxID=578221 RepID=A0ABS4HF53_9BACI|nr:3-phosphoshikimate 1-carboxyvinyltransferase [Virgibacillus litoralis]MBP1949570.1 3-phosphoshikimate 1-carboxyvinyltransferase [Virgibacillus litoralis]